MRETLEEMRKEELSPDMRQERFATLQEKASTIHHIVDVARDAVAEPHGDGLREVPLDDLIRDILEEYKRKIKAVGIKVQLVPLNVSTRGFRSLLRETFRNPIFNSIEELSEPESMPKKVLCIRMRKEEHKCVVEITDNGRGIPLE